MDLALDDSQELLVGSFRALLEKHSGPEDVRNAEPSGFDRQLWDSLNEVGPAHMAVSEAHGGWGASMVDLCLVAEEVGRRCASAPVIETQVAARLLGSLGGDVAGVVLERGAIATVALHPSQSAVAPLVPAGAVADVVFVRSGDDVRAVRPDPPPALVANHGNLPLADISLDGSDVLASGADAVDAFETAVDEWLLLTASTLVGMSASALALAVDYARERRAFGRPIGSFQGIAHRLADVSTETDGARLLVREAAWSIDVGSDDAAERSCMAFAFAAEVARRSTYWAVHTFGGYGVMVEYDAQLYFRRARAWSGVFGSDDAAYRRGADYRYRRQGMTA